MRVDKLAVAIIRATDARHHPHATDEDLYAMYGASAQILADGIRETIREEVQRNLPSV